MRSSRVAADNPFNPLEDQIQFRYRGSSMASTFSPGQTLYVRPGVREIQPGDVIVFRKEDGYVVHRAQCVTLEGVLTRGDNNRMEDGVISFEHIVGVVEKVGAQDGVFRVKGGKQGLSAARLRWRLSFFLDRLRPVLGKPYRWLRRKRWAGRVWHPKVTLLCIQSPTGVIEKYTIRSKVVATWQPDIHRFTCRKPFDLIIFPPMKPRE